MAYHGIQVNGGDAYVRTSLVHAVTTPEPYQLCRFAVTVHGDRHDAIIRSLIFTPSGSMSNHRPKWLS